MAGHSKWANVRHRKAAQDSKRGKIFTKIIRELTVAARTGPNPEDNPRLRAAVGKANLANMGRDAIERAIARGSGALDGDLLEEVTYEGYAPGGAALLVETMTDNRNRTVSEVRHAFSRSGGSLGTEGSVAWLFRRRGEIYPAADLEEEALLEIAVECGAEDVVQDQDERFMVLATVEGFYGVLRSLEQKIAIEDSDLRMVPENFTDVNEETAEKVLTLIATLEELDDVQNVYDNMRRVS